jgi:protein involved in polysaccharide export with SLBB domain
LSRRLWCRRRKAGPRANAVRRRRHQDRRSPDLDWTTRVEPDGTINFPYVGRIKAAGLTEDDLARTVERRLIELKIIAGP